MRLIVQAANVSYPSSLIQLISANQFHGDPYTHLATSIEICNTIKLVGVSNDAKHWLFSFKGNSLHTWDEVVNKFLNKYFLESKTTQGKTKILPFYQLLDEPFSEA